ncbi:MAG: hypothetical protein ACI8Y8_004420, partial [Planctomycetota bacterium]
AHSRVRMEARRTTRIDPSRQITTTLNKTRIETLTEEGLLMEGIPRGVRWSDWCCLPLRQVPVGFCSGSVRSLLELDLRWEAQGQAHVLGQVVSVEDLALEQFDRVPAPYRSKSVQS